MPTDTITPAAPGGASSGRREGRLDVGTRAWLVAILAASVLLRVAFLAYLAARPGFSWIDPDGYMQVAREMTTGGWHWLDEAIDYYQFVKPPLYPVLLSFLALAPGYPLTASLFQVAVGAVGGGLALFSIGRTLHSSRAGLIAAAVGALGAGITGTHAFLQESLAGPLTLIALAVLLRAAATSAPPRIFALAGLLFGVGALIRSMPLYYLPAAAVLYVAMAGDRRRATGQACVLLGTFALVILPYIVFISAHMNRLVLIDDQGSRFIVLAYSRFPLSEVPGITGAARMLWEAFVAAPVEFLGDRWELFRATFLLRGGNWLQLSAPVSDTAFGAMVWKILEHALSDLPTALTMAFAPFGFVLARNRRASALLVAWVVINIVLMTTFRWGTARYRASFESQLVVAAAVVAAGAWRRPPRWGVATAALASFILGGIVASSVPRTLEGRASYGVAPWQETNTARMTRVLGSAGFTLQRLQSHVTLVCRLPEGGDAADLEVRVNGRTIRKARVIPSRTVIVAYPWPDRRDAFIEIRATNAATGLPAPIELELPF